MQSMMNKKNYKKLKNNKIKKTIKLCYMELISKMLLNLNKN